MTSGVLVLPGIPEGVEHTAIATLVSTYGKTIMAFGFWRARQVVFQRSSLMVDPLIVDDVCGLFALGPAAPWDGRLCTNAQGASFRVVDVKGICLSHEITQLTKPERSGIEVGGDIGKLLSHRAERYPTILALYLFYYFIEDRRCVGKRLEGAWWSGPHLELLLSDQ